MSKKIELNKVSAVYDEKTDKVMLISKDERFKKTGFIVPLDYTKESTELLRNELVKKSTNSALMFEERTIPERVRNLDIVPLGFNQNNQEICWNIKEHNDLLITGKTASGKTSIVNSIVQYLQNETPYKVEHFSSDMTGSEENGVFLLEEAHNTVLDRLRESKDVKFRRGSEHIFYVIDELEFINISESYRSHLLESIVRSGKHTGVHLIIASHSPNKIKDLDFAARIITKNTLIEDVAKHRFKEISEFLVNDKSELFKPYVFVR